MILPFLFAVGLSAQAAPDVDPIQASAALVTPHDIVVDWNDPARALAAGHVVEWGTSPDDEFVVLGFLPPRQSTYRHPDLMPDTTCYYRVRAYYGPTSNEVDVSLPKDLSDVAYAKAFAKPEDYRWAAPEIAPERADAPKVSIRNAATASEGAPATLAIALIPTTVSGMKLTWIDRSTDEEGFMIEMRPDGATNFQVVAVVKPKVNGFGWAFNPPMRHATFRVRAYYYGRPSALVSQHTGPEIAATVAAKP